jgi:lipopolysaccharide biosynthesis glycosyltransferase
MKKIFIGYDPREDIAYQVCKHSILKRTTDATIKPLIKKDLEAENWYTRPIDKLASTEFTFTRFLVPALMEHKGWALFIDCDMLLQSDITELFELADDQYAVMVVKHKFHPTHTMKMDGRTQSRYPRKNWSSVMLFNCGHPSNKILTKELVNDETKDGAYFHRFSWLKDIEIGTLHHEWNYLVGHYYNHDGPPKLIHYTEGGPWFNKYYMQHLSVEWCNEYKDMTGKDFLRTDTIDYETS